MVILWGLNLDHAMYQDQQTITHTKWSRVKIFTSDANGDLIVSRPFRDNYGDRFVAPGYQ